MDDHTQGDSDSLQWQPRAQDYLIDSHVRKVREDGRVTLPRTWETIFGTEAYLWVGPAGQLRVFPAAFWERRARALDARQIKHASGEAEAKEFFSRSARLAIDVQGRFVLPKDIREKGGIGLSLRVVGRGSWFDILPSEEETL